MVSPIRNGQSAPLREGQGGTAPAREASAVAQVDAASPPLSFLVRLEALPAVAPEAVGSGRSQRPAGTFAPWSAVLRSGSYSASYAAEASSFGALGPMWNARVTVFDYLARLELREEQRDDARAVIDAVAREPRLSGLEDWVALSTGQLPGSDPGMQARNFLDDLGELRVALAMAPLLEPGDVLRVGADLRAARNPATGDLLPSFDLVAEGAARCNIDVFCPMTPHPSRSELTRAINHAADKVVRDPAVPEELWTTGLVGAAVVLRWPPPDREVRGGLVHVEPDGTQTLSTADGRTIEQGNLFEQYLASLHDPRLAPVGAEKVDALSVFDGDGRPLWRMADRKNKQHNAGRHHPRSVAHPLPWSQSRRGMRDLAW